MSTEAKIVEHKVLFLGQELTLRAPEGDHIERQLRKGHVYEHKLLAHIASLGVQGIYIDVGAHIGNHSVAFMAMGAAKVLSYEPFGASYKLLLDNLEAFVRAHDLWWLPYAASRKVVHDDWRYAKLDTVPDHNSGMARFIEAEKWDGGAVQCTRLDDELPPEHRVGLIKIDVEGGELAVLRSAQRIIATWAPVIVCEAQTEVAFAELDAWLTERGYRTDKVNRTATPTYVWTFSASS